MMHSTVCAGQGGILQAFSPAAPGTGSSSATAAAGTFHSTAWRGAEKLRIICAYAVHHGIRRSNVGSGHGIIITHCGALRVGSIIRCLITPNMQENIRGRKANVCVVLNKDYIVGKS